MAQTYTLMHVQIKYSLTHLQDLIPTLAGVIAIRVGMATSNVVHSYIFSVHLFIARPYTEMASCTNSFLEHEICQQL